MRPNDYCDDDDDDDDDDDTGCDGAAAEARDDRSSTPVLPLASHWVNTGFQTGSDLAGGRPGAQLNKSWA